MYYKYFSIFHKEYDYQIYYNKIQNTLKSM